MDPTSFEEPLLEANVTIILDDNDSLNLVSQTGLTRVREKSGEQVIATCIAAAKRRYAIIKEFLHG